MNHILTKNKQTNQIIFISIKTICILLSCLILYISPVFCINSEDEINSYSENYLLFMNKPNSNTENADILSLANISSNVNSLLIDKSDTLMEGLDDNEAVKFAWHKMAENAHLFAKFKLKSSRPHIEQFLTKANISEECKVSINDTLERVSNLDRWAMQMYNSFGNFPPSGLFEGTFNSIGSYHQCLSIKHNDIIGRPKYCVLNYQPLLPKRVHFHNILDPVSKLNDISQQDDAIGQFASKAQYFYYLKLKFATCLPTKCSSNDVDNLGRQVALNTYLRFAGSSCVGHEESLSLDTPEIVAIVILGGLAACSLLGTVLHILNAKSHLRAAIYGSRRSSVAVVTDNNSQPNHKTITNANGNNHNHTKQHQANLIHCNDGKIFAPLTNTDNENDNLSLLAIRQVKSVKFDANVDSLSAKSRSSIVSACVTLLPFVNFLLHFSVIKNAKKLFDTSTSRNGGSLATMLTGTKSKQQSTPLVASSKVLDPTQSSDEQQNNENENNNDDGEDNDDDDDDDEDDVDDQNDAARVETSAETVGDIGCVHGLRFWTISWIIFGHSMQYTDWAGLGKAFLIEENLTSLLVQPMLSASYSVDTFFLISGLLTTYVTWSITRGQSRRFNKFAFLSSRYLRLTPQVMLVILFYIILPKLDDGPLWRGLIKKESDNCKQNWWINALYLQAFVRSDRICNIVTWWLSIEMFYHFVSIFVILAFLHSSRRGITTAFTLGSAMAIIAAYLHYANSLSPGLLPTHLQRFEVWTKLILNFFWTPFPHAPAYFVGLVLGYLLFDKQKIRLTQKQVRFGWIFFVFSYIIALYGTYFWNNNYVYTRLQSSLFYNSAQILWALATGWAILACSLGHGSWLNSFLSAPIFVPLGRATYMTYLAHMLVVMYYSGRANMLIEPSKIVFTYIFLSNIIISYILGIILTLVYESPILHLQKLLVRKMAASRPELQDDDGNNNQRFSQHNNNKFTTHHMNNNNNNHGGLDKQTTLVSGQVKISLYDEQNQSSGQETIQNNIDVNHNAS